MAGRERAGLTARPLVFLHGLGTGPEAWRPQIEAFAASRRVIAPALRLDRDFGVAAEAARLVRQFEPDAPIDLCGLSLGALLGLRVALDQPARVRRLALCAGFAALPAPLSLLQAVLGASAAVLPKRILRKEFPLLDRGAVRAVFREGRRFDVRDELRGLPMPALILVGERDRANLRLSRTLAEMLGAELQVVPRAGHLANRDAPEEFNRILRSFLDEDAAAPSFPRRL